jgi:integrase
MTEQKRTRQANGRSSIIQTPDGFWHAWVTMGVKNDGSADRRHRRGRTQQEVANKVCELEKQREAGTVTTAGDRLTVAQWLSYWLENIAAAKVTEGTMSGYRPLVERHLIPGLGKHRLERLQPEHVEALWRKLAAQGMAPATVLKCHRILSRAIKVAVQRDKVRRNVCTLIDAPSIQPRRAEALTGDQARAVLAEAMKTRLAALWALRLEVGCRQGEALGLWWTDLVLDLDSGTGTATIRRQLRRLPARHGCGEPIGTSTVAHRGRTIERPVYPCGNKQPIRCPMGTGGGLRIVGYPKTKRPRHVALSPALVLVLVYHREAQAKEHEMAGSFWSDNPEFGPLVFRQGSGRPIDPRADYAAWVALLATAGVPTGGTHKARHTTATLLLEAGVPAKVVQEVLGHSSYRVTMDIYSHVTPTMSTAASERIEGVLWR